MWPSFRFVDKNAQQVNSKYKTGVAIKKRRGEKRKLIKSMSCRNQIE